MVQAIGMTEPMADPERFAAQSVCNLSLMLSITVPVAGWSSQVARRAHNPKVVGSNPAPAAIEDRVNQAVWKSRR